MVNINTQGGAKPWRLLLFDCMNTLLSLNTQTIPTMQWQGKTISSTAPLVHAYLQKQRPSITVAQVHMAARSAWYYVQTKRGQDHREIPAQQRFEYMLKDLHWQGDLAAHADDIKNIHMRCVVQAFDLPKERRHALQTLGQHYGLGLLSNFDDATSLQRQLGTLDIVHWFNPCLISEAIGVRKPALLAFGQALQASKLTADKVLFIGDSWEEDIQGACNAGMDAVWVNASHKPIPTQGTQPLRVVTDMAELVDLADW